MPMWHHRRVGSYRQQDWFFAGYSTPSETDTASTHSAAAEAACDELAGRNVEVKWEGNDQWYRGQICAQAPDRQGRRLVQYTVRS